MPKSRHRRRKRGARQAHEAQAPPAREEERPSEDDILEYIFKPGLQGLPVLGQAPSAKDVGVAACPPLPAELEDRLRQLDIEGIRAAEENKDFDRAVELFSQAIELCPHYAPAYNDRALVYQKIGDLDKAERDIDLAIEHGAGNASVLKQAYSQRGILLMRKGDTEGARAAFEKGGRLGHAFARQRAVELNPYAAMCNAMLSKAIAAMDDLMREEPPSEGDSKTEHAQQ